MFFKNCSKNKQFKLLNLFEKVIILLKNSTCVSFSYFHFKKEENKESFHLS